MPIKDAELRRKYAREWVAKRRAAFFKDKVCQSCNSTALLELHHLDRANKKANSIWSWSETRRNEELKKCIILCESCHKKETLIQLPSWKNSPILHGIGESGYRRGCRCTTCKASYSQLRKERWRRIRK